MGLRKQIPERPEFSMHVRPLLKLETERLMPKTRGVQRHNTVRNLLMGASEEQIVSTRRRPTVGGELISNLQFFVCFCFWWLLRLLN